MFDLGRGKGALRIRPLARSEELQLARTGDELVLTLAGHRRVVALPSALRRCVVAGAVLTDGRLTVRFEPDPALWPRSTGPLQ